MSVESASGKCLCGGVSFALRFPSKWVAHCHCTRCQLAHGAAFVTWIGMLQDQVSIDDSKQLLHWFSTDSGSSRGFCSACGSSMFFKAPAWPGELHVARSLVSGAVDRQPQAHAYFDTHVGWINLVDDLPRRPDPANK